MSFGHCSCPECGTILRIRDRSFVGRRVPCPECRVSLLIEFDRNEVLTARQAPKDLAPKQSHGTSKRAAVDNKLENGQPSFLNAVHNVIYSPLVMAWVLGLAVTTLVVVAMLRPNVRFRPTTGSGRPTQPEHGPAEVVQSTDKMNATDVFPTDSRQSDQEPLEEPIDAMVPVNREEPLPASSPPASEPEVAVVAKLVEPVQAKPPTPAPPKINFSVALGQPLQSFEQPKPVSRRELIDLLEELLGAPIRYDVVELGESNLTKLVTVKKLENTTVQGVLKSILDSAGWEFLVEETQLRVRPKTDQANSQK